MTSQTLTKSGGQFGPLLIAPERMVGLRNCLELIKLPHQVVFDVTWLAPLLLLA